MILVKCPSDDDDDQKHTTSHQIIMKRGSHQQLLTPPASPSEETETDVTQKSHETPARCTSDDAEATRMQELQPLGEVSAFISAVLCSNQCRLVLNNVGGGRKQTESTGDLVQAPFFSSSERLVKGICVKIKPNVLSSGDIALASSLISTCLSTDELLLSGTRVVENGPIT